ncbi:MAG: hypothetical protein ACYS47_16490 [Planctomycetota bacterium]
MNRNGKNRGSGGDTPLDVEIEGGEAFSRLTFRGELTREAAIDVIRRVYGSPAFDPETHVLCDIRGVTIRMRSYFEIRDIIKVIRKSATPGQRWKRAILSDNDAVFGMMRMLQSYAEGDLPVRIAVFRDREAAVRWFEEK